MTTRSPSRSDSSFTSVIPSIRLSRANSAMRSINLALLTMYGNSVATMRSRPFFSVSISTFARKIIVPCPVSYALRIPDLPITIPPVGKSGPGTASIKSAVVASSLFIKIWIALMTSDKLCGGIFVVIPTAIPVAPLTNKFGKRAGKIDGSRSVPS